MVCLFLPRYTAGVARRMQKERCVFMSFCLKKQYRMILLICGTLKPAYQILKRAKRVKFLNSKPSTLNFYFNPRPISIASGFGSAPRNVRYNSIGSSVPPFSSNVRNFCAVSWSKMPFSLNNAYASLSNTSAHK